jgi:hypothetical protein
VLAPSLAYSLSVRSVGASGHFQTLSIAYQLIAPHRGCKRIFFQFAK